MTSSAQGIQYVTLNTVKGDKLFHVVNAVIDERVFASYQIHLMLESTTHDITPDAMLGKPIACYFHHDVNKAPSCYHGIVSHFAAHEIDGTLRGYEMVAVPFLELLKQQTDCRIFQNLSVPEIIAKVLKEGGTSIKVEKRLYGEHKAWVHCCQYHETTYDFLHRIMAEEGIFYYYTFTDEAHILTLADKSSVSLPIADEKVIFHDNMNQRSKGISEWWRGQKVYTGKVTQVDYNFEQSRNQNLASSAAQQKLKYTERFESYLPDTHQDTNEASKKADLQLHANEAEQFQFHGKSTYASFKPGHRFVFEKPPIAKEAGDYFIVSVSHLLTNDATLVGQSHGVEHYLNHFSVLPKSEVSFFPSHQAYPKPSPRGPHLAMVVGPDKEEVYTDKLGRIKIRFYWERGEALKEKTSFWVHVVQPWAGNKFGMQFIPRVGQVVLVDFLDGDIDKPIVRGSVYNDSLMPPFDLPVHGTQSGIKTQTIGSKSANCHNMLRFEDAKDQEEFYMHAQKDMNTVVQNNKKDVVQKGDMNIEVQEGSYTLTAKKSIKLSVQEKSVIEMIEAQISISSNKVIFNAPQ